MCLGHPAISVRAILPTHACQSDQHRCLWRVWCVPVLQLSEIVSRTRTIKAAVEAAVSKQFAGRRVNVLGEINNALSASA